MVNLPAPKDFRMTQQDEIECTYFRDDYMALNLADEDDDQPTNANNYSSKFQTWHGQCTKEEQRPFVDAVLKAVTTNPKDTTVPRYFFLTGAGGTGKTFTYNVNLKISFF